MRKNKFLLSIIVSIFVLLLNCSVFAEPVDNELRFNEYGFKTLEKQSIAEEELFGNIRAKSSSWESFPSKFGVDLEKVWTVEFSSTVSMYNLDSIAIEKDNQFIPVRITKIKNDTITVQPIESFSGNSKYTMRILLNNGKKYKMDFTTKPEYRNADIEPNHNYLDANEIYLNETIKGSFSEGDYNDFYKIELPYNGRLDLKAIQRDGEKLSLYLYGPYGDDKSSIANDTYQSTAFISQGLQAGTYYIKVNYANSYGDYTLENKFYISEYEDDNGINNYINADKIKLNDSFTGHIGYYSDYNRGNFNDFYKIELPEDGELNIKATHLGAKKLSLYLYGPYGDDKSSIISDTYQSTASITKGLQSGTYYVKIYSEEYGPYKLENIYYPNKYGNDNGVNNYINADKINLNDSFTGHIGYYSDYNRGNFNDFYKIELPEDGDLDIKATHLDGKKLSLYLYGEYGDDRSSIASDTYRSSVNIKRSLKAGTYYVKIYSEEYGPYRLETSF